MAIQFTNLGQQLTTDEARVVLVLPIMQLNVATQNSKSLTEDYI
ncbi:MAG: hypothetical protein ACFBSC_20710 [Microcoleaceae cyanobacterium]